MNHKFSAALIIYNKDKNKFLKTKRPLDDDSLPGAWGFPAGTKKDQSETWGSLVSRIAKAKLGIEVRIVKLIGEETMDREDYIITLRDYEVKIIKNIPCVPQVGQEGTQYISLKWTDIKDVEDIKESAKEGGLCSRIFCKAHNIKW